MASIFPEDIIQEILLRLPVKSLVRFKCVSKTWGALIESPSFVKSHLTQSTITKSMEDIIFDNGHCIKLNQLRYERSDNIVDEEFKHPLTCWSYSSPPEIMGPCYGLFYMINSCNPNAILFNPSTRSYFITPNIEEVEGLISRIRGEHHPDVPPMGSFTKRWYWGFGYDEVNDDFKLVGIRVEKSYRNIEWEYFGWIYSVKLGTWRRIDDMLNCHITSSDQCGAFLYNAVHWVIYDHPFEMHTPRFVAAFDMGTEEFRLMPLPNYINNDPTYYFYFNLEFLDECLCFCCCSRSEDYSSWFLEFWIMREYAANESNWVKLVKIVIDSECAIWSMKPLAFSENGKLLLVFVKYHDFNQTLAWYDLETGLLKRKIDKLPRELGVPHLYIPSLVNPSPHAKVI